MKVDPSYNLRVKVVKLAVVGIRMLKERILPRITPRFMIRSSKRMQVSFV